MNDLDLVRDMRADVPPRTRAQLALGRARLLASISGPSRPRTLRRAILPAGAAAAVAVAVVVASGAVSGPATRSTAPAIRLTLTAQLLNTAAATVATEPAVRPGPHQWFYTKFVQYQYGQPKQSGGSWETFDGRQTAYFLNGQLIVHTSTAPVITGGGRTALDKYNANATSLTAYNALASLPASPRALLAVVVRQLAAVGAQNVAAGSPVSGPAGRGGLEFDYLATLLWNAAGAVAPPSAEAAVFRAMATIPGISSQRGITDVAGQPAIGLSASGGESQLLLDPQTYQVIGARQFSEGQKFLRRVAGRKANKLHMPPKGTLFISMAWAQVTMVSGPGRT
jgi:hypothetical protein